MLSIDHATVRYISVERRGIRADITASDLLGSNFSLIPMRVEKPKSNGRSDSGGERPGLPDSQTTVIC